MGEPTDFARHLSGYFIGHMAGARDLSENTIASRRTTFSLLIKYCREVEDIPTRSLTIDRIDRPLVERYLTWCEESRDNCVSTRNVRLEAIKAFFSYLQDVAPEHLLRCQQIAAIPRKTAPRPVVRWLTLGEVDELLHGIDRSTWAGMRDVALLSLLYDSGARVSELCGATVADLRLEEPACIRLLGKGRKERFVPLMGTTVEVLRAYLRRRSQRGTTSPSDPLFAGRGGRPITRGGVTYVLKKHWSRVRPEGGKKVTPHVLRHSKAVHLLQASVDLIYIRDFLGHASVDTTEVYAKCDHAAIRKALGGAAPADAGASTGTEPEAEWERDPSVLSWLESLAAGE